MKQVLAGLNLLERVVEYFRDDAGKKRTADFEAGVCVDLNKIQPEILVDHEIIAKQL